MSTSKYKPETPWIRTQATHRPVAQQLSRTHTHTHTCLHTERDRGDGQATETDTGMERERERERRGGCGVMFRDEVTRCVESYRSLCSRSQAPGRPLPALTVAPQRTSHPAPHPPPPPPRPLPLGGSSEETHMGKNGGQEGCAG